MAEECVLEFSSTLPPLSSYVTELINKIVRLVGGKRFYIEGNKIVVVK